MFCCIPVGGAREIGVCPREVHATEEEVRLGLALFFFCYCCFSFSASGAGRHGTARHGTGQVGSEMRQMGDDLEKRKESVSINQ